MINLLCVYEQEIPTVSIMRKQVESTPDPLGTVTHFKRITEVTPADIDWCDMFEMIRPADPYTLFLAKRVYETGGFVVTYLDDDLCNPFPSRPTPKWRIRSTRKAVEMSNMLISCSPHITAKYRDLTAGKRAMCSDSVINPNEIKMIPELPGIPENQKVKLVYAASPAHVTFFNRYILPIMPQLAEKYAGKISMTFMGLKPELSDYEDRIDIEYFGTMPLEEYRQKVQDGNYDIGLSPLTTDEFTKCKYFNKFIEYSMAGIMGLYSNTEPYTYVVKDGENGLLVNDDPQDWYEALCRAIDDAMLRNRCVRNAQQLLLTAFTNEAYKERLQREVPELVHYDAPKTPCKGFGLYKLLPRLVTLADRSYQIWFYTTHGGMSTLMGKIKSRLRGKNAYS